MGKFGVVIVGVLTLSVLAVAVYLWVSLGDVAMGMAGYLTVIGGALATLALGGGLMALLFYSHRHGFDEQAGHYTLQAPPGRPAQPMENGDKSR